MGSHPEKLLTLEEAARRLGIPADDVEAMVKSGRLASFRLGGSVLRFRLADVEALRSQKVSQPPVPPPDRSSRLPASSLGEKLLDFLYANDFYLVALLIILTLLALIFAL